MPPPDIKLPLAFALTLSRERSAIPPRSKTGELTPFSVPRREFWWPAFQVGKRLLECEFWRPFTRVLDIPELLLIGPLFVLPANELLVIIELDVAPVIMLSSSPPLFLCSRL